MTERRYQEAEVRRIFELATRAAPEQPAPAAADGLTLQEIQSIGMQVGVDPDAVGRAAAALDAPALRPQRRSMGMPIEVAHTVQLPRNLTDREWEQLVAELRSTFRARGRISEHGSLREWSNGNLHASLEPAEQGYRLRMGTHKGDVSRWNALGVASILTGVFAFGSLIVSGEVQGAILLPSMLGAGGAGAILTNLLRLPSWRAQRKQQMQHIASRVAAMVRATQIEPAGDAGSDE